MHHSRMQVREDFFSVYMDRFFKAGAAIDETREIYVVIACAQKALPKSINVSSKKQKTRNMQQAIKASMGKIYYN